MPGNGYTFPSARTLVQKTESVNIGADLLLGFVFAVDIGVCSKLQVSLILSLFKVEADLPEILSISAPPSILHLPLVPTPQKVSPSMILMLFCSKWLLLVT